jgi:hypothetical protein
MKQKSQKLLRLLTDENSASRRTIESTRDLKGNPRHRKLNSLPLGILYSVLFLIVLQDFVLGLLLLSNIVKSILSNM